MDPNQLLKLQAFLIAKKISKFWLPSGCYCFLLEFDPNIVLTVKGWKAVISLTRVSDWAPELEALRTAGQTNEDLWRDVSFALIKLPFVKFSLPPPSLASCWEVHESSLPSNIILRRKQEKLKSELISCMRKKIASARRRRLRLERENKDLRASIRVYKQMKSYLLVILKKWPTKLAKLIDSLDNWD